MKLTAKQELLLELYSELDPEQQAEVLAKLRTTADANKVARRMIAPATLRVVGNLRVEQTLGLPDTTKETAATKEQPQRRDPGTPLDGALGTD